MFEHSETLGKIAPAIVAAQKEVKNPLKDSRNPHYGNTFAGLAGSVAAVKEAFNKQGIAIVQTFTPAEAGYMRLSTVLLHTSGEFIGGDITMPLPKPDPQGVGSAATYARRYAIQAIAGVVGEDDDDAESAVIVPVAPIAEKQTEKPKRSIFDRKGQ